ncbi:trichohyalin-like [Oncorhynchus kisutch]|uniref:trichohyalin-like n=1 Tax=Oncorhynchus kisutch TaxID=8019 RepID=UPI0012DD927A|nr:trichohyalin-like [Oncorhynchus kisutch]
MREREREMEEEMRRFREKSERQKVEKQMELQKKRQEERDEWEIFENKRVEEWKEFYRKEEDIRKEESWMKAERKANRKVEEGKRKMGEEQQMLKKQASLTETLSDGKRRNLEERKEDENNMGEKCVKEAREGDRGELLKEKRQRQIAEEHLTHMEKQMMEREGERKRELESQIREEKRKHEEEIKMRKLKEDLMREKRHRQIAEENRTHMEKQMRELEEREEERKRERESQIREEKRKHEEEIKMRKLKEDLMREKRHRQIAEENLTHMEKQMRELEEREEDRKREHESQIREEKRKHEEEIEMRKLEDMKNEMFGKIRELEEERKRELENQIREDMRKREEEMKMRKLEEDLMKEKRQRQIAEENLTHMEKQMRELEEREEDRKRELESQIREEKRKHEEEMKMRKLEDMKNEMFGKMRELEERMKKMERQHAEKTTMEEEKEERKRVEDTVRMKELNKTALDVWEFHFGSHECLKHRSDSECSDCDDSKSVKAHQKKTDKGKNETMEALLSEDEFNSSDDDDGFTEMKQKDGHKNMLVEEKVATNCCQNDHPGKVKVQNDLAGDIDWSESDYSEIEEIIDSDTEDISEEIKETDEEEEVEDKTDIESDERTVRNVIRSECDDDKSGKPNMKKGMVDKDNTDNNVEKEKTTQSNTKREEGERKEVHQSQDTETYKTNGATESDELTLAPGKGSDSNDSERVKSNQEKEKDDQKDTGQLESQEEKKEDRILAGAERETQHPQEDQSETCKDFSIFAAAMVKTQGPDEDQLAVEGKTNNTQTDQAAKVKGEKDLDNDWSESDSEIEEITADFEIDEETDQPATCGDYSISIAEEVKIQDPDKNQPAKLKDSSIFLAGVEVKQTQSKDVSLVAAAESKTLKPQEEQPAKCKDLSVFAAAGGKTQDSAKVKGEKDLDNDWSESDSEIEEITADFEIDEETDQPATCGDYSISIAEEVKIQDPDKNQPAKLKDSSIFLAGVEVKQTQSKDVSLVAAAESKTLKPQEEQPAKCKDLSVFAAAGGKTQDSAKVKGEKDLDNDWSESDSEIEEITADFEIDEETDQPATCGDYSISIAEEVKIQDPDKNQPAKLKDSSIFLAGVEVKQTQSKDVSLVAAAESKTLKPQEEQPAKCKDLSVFAAAGGKTQDSAKVKGEKDLDNDWSESDSEIEEITADFEIDEETDQPATCGDYSISIAEEVKIQDPDKNQPAKLKDSSIFLAGVEVKQTQSKDVSLVAAAESKTLKPQEEQPAKCKDLSVFAAAGGKTQDSAKVKGEKDLDNDWSESDSEIEEITADFEIDEETDQPATCGDYSISIAEEVKIQDPDKNQPAKLKDSSIFLAGVEVKQTQSKDVSLVAAAESKTLKPQEEQPAKCKDLSVFAAAGGKTQDSAKVKGEKDLDNDWSESDSEIEEITADFEIDEETDQPATCGAGGQTQNTQTDQATKVKGEQDLDIDWSESDYDSEGTMDSDKEFIDKDEWTKWSMDIEEKKACTQVQHDGNTAERDIINQEKKKVQPAKCKDLSIFSAGAQTQQTQQCKAGGKTQNTQTDQATKVKGEQDLDIDTDWSESDYDSYDEFITEEVWQKWKEDNEKKRLNKDDTVTPLPNTDRIDGEVSREKIGKINQEQRAAAEGKTQNPQTYQPVKVKGENDLTSGGMNQEKTEIEVLQRSRQEQPAKCKGMAKVPPVQQAKVSYKSEIVQKKDGNDKVTEPKTDAELIMEKYERMVEEGRRGPGQKDRRDKDMAKESKEEQRRLRNEKALQDHLDSVENQEGTSKQTRQPQCIGMTKVPPGQQAKVSNKSEIVQKKDGNDKVTEPKTDAELIMEKYERMVEEGRRGPGQKDRRDKDMAKESKEEQRRLRNEKALQDHLDSVENQEGTSKQTRQPQCIGDVISNGRLRCTGADVPSAIRLEPYSLPYQLIAGQLSQQQF